MMRAMDVHALLLHVEPLLRSRCKTLAWKLPGVSADDLFQDCVYEFLRRLGGWMQHASHMDTLGQGRQLAVFCFMNVRTAAFRARARWAEMPVDADGELREGALAFADTGAGPEQDDDLLELFAAARDCTKPPQALSFLSLRVPAVVVRADAARAKAYPAADFVPRPLDEAWHLFANGRADLMRVADDVGWKRDVAVAWCTEGPIDELAEDSVRRAVGRVEKYANRAADDLLARAGARA
jgi:hypothetical protein